MSNTGLDVDLTDLSDYDNINPYYCIYNTAILLTLIGKRLNDQNYRAWIESRNNSFAVPLGFSVTDPNLMEYQPSQNFAAAFYSGIKSRWEIRRRCFVEIWALSTRAGMLGNACKTMLTLFRGAELTNFVNISQWLLLLNPELFCWNALAKSLPLILRAYKKFISVGELADYIKLILPDEHVREFHRSTLRVPFTIARKIAVTYGSSTLQRVEGIDHSPETQMLVDEAMMIVRTAGGARTMDTQAIRQWRLNGHQNPELERLLNNHGTQLPAVTPLGSPNIGDRRRPQSLG
ncbi:unnamed protein product [Bemisia tabaci]|uniref:Uncharacterized protein n=1 Tax=Bemisia tabaci TaxID=7038 RepID=A0A9P0A2F4_BEMTA|nr:unnamed protein product [Bemisia tabaci]